MQLAANRALLKSALLKMPNGFTCNPTTFKKPQISSFAEFSTRKALYSSKRSVDYLVEKFEGVFDDFLEFGDEEDEEEDNTVVDKEKIDEILKSAKTRIISKDDFIVAATVLQVIDKIVADEGRKLIN